MDEMRGGASTLHKDLADRDAQTGSPGNIMALHPLTWFRFGWKTVPTFLAKML